MCPFAIMTENRSLSDKFMLRMPEGLRDRIKKKADENGRSMNAEILQGLERDYPAPSDVMHVHLKNIRKALDKYEASEDPRERLQLQLLVSMMVDSGTNLSFEDDEDFD